MVHWKTLVATIRAVMVIALVTVVAVLTAATTSALVSFSKELATLVVVSGFVTAMGLAVAAFSKG